MKQSKRVLNQFEWVPIQDRRPDMPPRKPENRKPKLWLATKPCDEENDIGYELYLVNEMEEMLSLVNVYPDGVYKDVQPKEAVMVDKYDGYYDLDYLMNVALEIKAESLGHIRIVTPASKGGIGEMVLLWDSGEAGKHVGVTKVD